MTPHGVPQRWRPKKVAPLTRIIDFEAANGLRQQLRSAFEPTRPCSRGPYVESAVVHYVHETVPEWRARIGARMKTIMCPNGNDHVPEWYCNENEYVPEWEQ